MDIDTKCVDNNTVICTSVQTIQLRSQNSLAVVESKIELDSHPDTCFADDYCLVVHYHNKPVMSLDMLPKKDQSMPA